MPTWPTRSSWRRVSSWAVSSPSSSSLSSPCAGSRTWASVSGMPAMRHSSAAGNAACEEAANSTAASKWLRRSLRTRCISASPRMVDGSAFSAAAPSAVQGALKVSSSSTACRCGRRTRASGAASSVRCVHGIVSCRAAKAAVEASTPATPSSRTSSTRRTLHQRRWRASASERASTGAAPSSMGTPASPSPGGLGGRARCSRLVAIMRLARQAACRTNSEHPRGLPRDRPLAFGCRSVVPPR